MIRSLKEQIGSILRAVDGESGRVKDVLLNGGNWFVRHLVAVPHPPRLECQALILPREISKIREPEIFTVLTVEEIEARTGVRPAGVLSSGIWPLVVEGRVVSVRMGEEMVRPDGGQAGPVPAAPRDDVMALSGLLGSEMVWDDGPRGKLYDLLFDDDLWLIRFAVVALADPERKKMLVFPNWIGRGAGNELTVHVELFKGRFLRRPEFDERKHLYRRYEDIIDDIFPFENLSP
jgi:hypothetical protein